MNMSMIELKNEEIGLVAGAGTFLGDTLIQTSNLANDALNLRPVALFGQVFSLFGSVGKAAHQLPDTGGYLLSQAVVGTGEALGGTVTPTYHYEKEQSEGLYLL